MTILKWENCISACGINPFVANTPFLYPLKISENLEVKGILGINGLNQCLNESSCIPLACIMYIYNGKETIKNLFSFWHTWSHEGTRANKEVIHYSLVVMSSKSLSEKCAPIPLPESKPYEEWTVFIIFSSSWILFAIIVAIIVCIDSKRLFHS